MRGNHSNVVVLVVMVENNSFLVVSVLNLVVDRGVKTTENNVVVVEERKELGVRR